MIDIFFLYQTVASTVNVQQNGNMRPWDFTNWVNSIQMQFFLDRVANFGKNQVGTDELSAFLKIKNVVTTQAPGQPYCIMRKPSDYKHFANATIMRQTGQQKCSCKEENTDVIDGSGNCLTYQDSDYAAMIAKYAGSNLSEETVYLINAKNWGGAMKHLTKGPSWGYPLITEFDGGFKVAPRDISVVVLSYFRIPDNAVFAYTVDDDDTIIYNASGSTQLEWPESMTEEFVRAMVAKYMGYTRDGEGIQILNASK